MIRVFGRFRALKTLVASITASFVPMVNAFLIMFVVVSMCAWHTLKIVLTVTHTPIHMPAYARTQEHTHRHNIPHILPMRYAIEAMLAGNLVQDEPLSQF